MDYIFYRMYQWERKHKHYGRHSAILFISVLHLMWCIWLITLCSSVISQTYFDVALACFIACFMIIDNILLSKRYNEKKIVVLLRKYKNYRRNKFISNWCFILLAIISIPSSFFITVGVVKIIAHIFSYEGLY
jgi:hypothetical protein